MEESGVEPGASRFARSSLQLPRPGTPPPTRHQRAVVLSAPSSRSSSGELLLLPLEGSAPEAAPWCPRSPTLVLHLIAGAMTTLMCLLLTATTWHDMAGRGERTAMLLQCAVKLAVLIYVLRKPSSFWEHRAWASPCIRILFHLSPVMRRTGVGVYLLLERHAPKPGWYGAWADAARILAGTRQLGAAVGGLTLMMPPAQMLLTQTLLLLLTRNEPAYCTAPLLTHPLVHQRSALVATVLEYATLPILLLPFKPVGADIAALVAASQSGTQLCGALLTFFQVALIIIGPTLAAIHWWQPPTVPPPEVLEEEHAAAPALTARRYWHQTTVEWEPRRRLRGAIAHSFDAANRALRFCLRTPGGLASRMFVCYWLLAITWWLCKRSYGLH